ncbi:MAG TPA: sulfatase-like hydrolase/transferase [Sphingobacteriaceae bacterium]
MRTNVIVWITVLCGIVNPIDLQAQKVKPRSAKQPNIIFILTDDLGYGDVGVFYQKLREKNNNRSEPWMFTPHLDRLAVKGAQLTQQYCAAPVCAPSRASLLLGVSQGHSNIRDNQFDKALENNHTMASVLNTSGYATAAIGKWGLQGDKKWDKDGEQWPSHPLNRGFDYFFGYMRHGDGHEHYPKEGVYRSPKKVWENRDTVDGLDKCYTGDLWTAAAKKWIMDHKKGKQAKSPFFMYLAYDTPHAVLELPTQAYPQGGGLKGGLQWLGTAGHMINTATGKVDSWIHPDYANAVYDDDNNPSTPEKPWPEVYKRYATSVRRIDSGVGDIVALLKDLNIDSNTMIVFTSDNGPSLESYLPKTYAENLPDFFNSFGPFDGVKRDVLEGGVRMPTIAFWPGHIPAGHKIKTPNMSYDWLPTFTDIAGVAAPARTDGVSLFPALSNKSGTQRKSKVYIEYFNNGKTPDLKEFDLKHQNRKRNQMQMIGIDNLIGVRYDIKSHADNFEIYDVAKDPRQTKNLANETGMADVQKQMKERVLQLRRPDTTASRPYDNEFVSPIAKKTTNAGVFWKAYSGNFNWIPDVSSLVPAASGQTNRPSVNLKDMAGKSVCFFEGYLQIPADGSYTFYLNADGGALLRIHDALVIDADFGYKGNEERQGKILLKAGLHPFRVYYKTKPKGSPLLDFKWEGPGIAKQPVPAAIFRRD